MRRQGNRVIGGKKRAGFTLIELAIVLAVTALLTAGLWRMMSSGNTQLRDQAAADQHKDLINAVRGYLASGDGQASLSALLAGGVGTLSLPASNLSNANCKTSLGAVNPNFCDFLPLGFTNASTNAYDQTYEIQFLKDNQPGGTPPQSYSFMIKTVGGETIPDTSGGRISSLIGSDGGFVYNATVCGAGGTMACGAFGSWNAAPDATYGYSNTAAGQVASRTFVGLNAALNTPWLARLNVDGDATVASGIDDYNTIQTDISLGGNVLSGLGDGSNPGGELNNFRRLLLEKPGALDPNAALEISGCQPTSPGDPACTDTVTITGGVNITGILKATSLYASSFIYDTTPSDRRLKHDIAPIKEALSKFGKLSGYSFVMNGQKETRYGVIAQEVEKVFPHVVHERADGTKAVDYMGLIGPLVQAVHDLKAENDELKKEIERIKEDQKRCN